MVRMLESQEVVAKSGIDASIEAPKSTAAPTAEEVRALVHGPRRPIRWMRWLSALVLVVATAAVVTYAISNDDADTLRYQTPASAGSTAGVLTMADYLPVSSGQVYNYNPTIAEP